MEKIMLYFIMISLLFPRGFAENSSAIRIIYLIWLALAVVLMVMQIFYYLILKKMKLDKFIYMVATYYIVFWGITIYNKGEIGEGVQKLFVAPIVIVFLLVYLKVKPQKVLKVIENTLIVLFLLNIVFYPVFKYILDSYHIYFLGHVQMYSQISVLAILVAYLNQYYLGKNKKSCLLIFLSLITLLLSRTAVSYICIAIYLILKVLIALKADRIVRCKPSFYFALFVFLNLFLLWYTFKLRNISTMNNLFSLSSRTFIWTDAIYLAKEKLLFGYGAYGVLIKTFWSSWSVSAGGFNYAHNELIQHLLDGGVVLLILFLILFFLSLAEASKIKNKYLYKFIMITVLMFIAIMLIESVTEYYIFFVYLAIFLRIPKINNKIIKDRSRYGLIS
ncbi:MAG: O-antigen ligase family protein [Roseburia sp.]|nr:O-antigen ligase family protein [Anaeroplasma bactoclasticum]MCM1196272.1 O-antigen ligase family protein [Roseburia sp.]MCM1557379.1 O-antigen ligase family protein [Anaeroplasma bactoclasticum]